MPDFKLVDQSGKSYQIPPERDGLIIGRHRSCGLIVSDPAVSRHHARLFIARGRCWIRDENSKSGTIVNQHRITTQQELQPGSIVQIGPATFSLKSDPSAKLYQPPHLHNTRRRTAITLIGVAGVSIVVLALPLAGRESSVSSIIKFPTPCQRGLPKTKPKIKRRWLCNTR